MNKNTRTEQRITVKELAIGDELVYMDGNQIITNIERFTNLNLRTVYDIYVEGIDTPRRQPGFAPVLVLR